MYYAEFLIERGTLTSELHFDLYSTYIVTNGKKEKLDTIFAPFSKDAESAWCQGAPGCEPVAVPDGGATLSLLGAALLGLGALRRRLS